MVNETTTQDSEVQADTIDVKSFYLGGFLITAVEAGVVEADALGTLEVDTVEAQKLIIGGQEFPINIWTKETEKIIANLVEERNITQTLLAAERIKSTALVNEAAAATDAATAAAATAATAAPVSKDTTVTTPEDTSLDITLTGTASGGGSFYLGGFLITAVEAGVVEADALGTLKVDIVEAQKLIIGGKEFPINIWTKETEKIIANLVEERNTTQTLLAAERIKSATLVNDNAPVFISSTTFEVDEGQTDIGTVEASDADGDSVIFTVSGSELAIGDTTGLLTFASAPDFETKSSYTATVTASDGINETSQVITVNVTNVNDAPVITSSTMFSAAENQTEIGTVTATDADGGDSVTFAVSGSDAASLSINSSSGLLTFASAPDFETKSSYTATVTASDGINETSQVITVNVTNVNDAPVITSSTMFSAAENQTEIGTVTATDADGGDSVTFAVSGSDAASLSINSSSGLLTFASAPDFETKSSYTATVTASDGINETSQVITVNVTNVNDAPVITSSATFSAAENQTEIGTVTATDADGGDSVTFAVSGSDAASLSINSSSGLLTFASAPDFETKSSYTATVTASDGINETSQVITVNVTNVNDAPVITSSATFSAAENQTEIGTVTATDADGGDSVTFAVSGSDAASLSINSSSGLLTFASAPDFETKSSYTATVTASDGINETSQVITVNVTNVNDAPVITSSATFSAAENQTEIGTVTATDADGGDSVTFAVSGSDAASLSINSSSGLLTFASAPDFETKSSYTATVTASDGINETSQVITVNVTNVNDAPVITSSATFSAAENQTEIGTVTATDADGGDSVTFAVSGSDAASLSINSSSGLLTFASAPDFETKSSYTATVTASDGINETSQVITVNVTNVNDAPVITSSATFSAAENQTEIGTVTATDADGGDSVTFAVSGSDAASLSINSSSGLLTFASAPDFETKSSYTATVTASDGINETSQVITVNVTNVNEAPVFTSSATFEVAENQTEIGTVTATDADGGDSVTFAVSGSDAASLSINSSSGLLTFASAPDFETKSSYTATVTASDGINETSQVITVNVTNVNDAPVITSSATFSAAENQTEIGTVTATDADGGDSVTFAVSGSDAASLSINSSSGLLTFASAPDFETKSSYTATVTASDGINETSQVITVNVTNVNEAPVFTSSATFEVAEDETPIGTVIISDADGDSVTFTVSGTELKITSAGVLTYVSAPNHLSHRTTATVTASDGTNSSTQAIEVLYGYPAPTGGVTIVDTPTDTIDTIDTIDTDTSYQDGAGFIDDGDSAAVLIDDTTTAVLIDDITVDTYAAASDDGI